jgi:hypothetical protein
MYDVQHCDSYINIPSSGTYRISSYKNNSGLERWDRTKSLAALMQNQLQHRNLNQFLSLSTLITYLSKVSCVVTSFQALQSDIF